MGLRRQPATLWCRFWHQDLIRLVLYGLGVPFIGATGANGLSLQGGVCTNSSEDMRLASQMCAEVGLGAAIWVFEPAWLHSICSSARKGTLPKGSRMNLYFGGKSLLANRTDADIFGT